MPLTQSGFEPRTLAEIVEVLQTELRSRISDKLVLSERSVVGNLLQIFAAQLVQVEALASEAYAAFDPDSASDDRLVALALLTGVVRRGATKGLVATTLNLDASLTFAPGDLVAHVTDEPDNRWLNRDTVTSTTAGAYGAVFQSETAGALGTAPAGTLTVIAGPVAGWNTITNAADATAGQDIEAIEDLRLRRELAVSAGGSRTRNAIRAKVIALDGVLSAEVFENTSNTTDANGIPPHAIRVVVYDGSPAAADDDAIADAIYQHKAEGISSTGTQTGTAQDEVLGPVLVAFDRATIVPVDVDVEIESATGVTIVDVQAAIEAVFPDAVGDEITFNRLSGAVFRVAGVDDWVSFEVAGGTADLPAVQSTIYIPGTITVTGDVS